MVPGLLVAQIGESGLHDALQRGWVQPDMESGFLVLSPQVSALQEMERLSDYVCAKCGKDECACDAPSKKEESFDPRAMAMSHAHRLTETLGLGMGASTSGSPGSGQPARPAGPTPQAPTSPTAPNRAGEDYVVGEDVVIADEGKAYQAKIASRSPDGTYKLTFGPNRPIRQDRTFRREEMQRVDPRGQAVVPVTRP